jgi:hypothetical protein
MIGFQLFFEIFIVSQKPSSLGMDRDQRLSVTEFSKLAAKNSSRMTTTKFIAILPFPKVAK